MKRRVSRFESGGERKKFPVARGAGAARAAAAHPRDRELLYGKIYNVLNKNFSFSAKIPPAKP